MCLHCTNNGYCKNTEFLLRSAGWCIVWNACYLILVKRLKDNQVAIEISTLILAVVMQAYLGQAYDG